MEMRRKASISADATRCRRYARVYWVHVMQSQFGSSGRVSSRKRDAFKLTWPSSLVQAVP